MCLCVWVCVYLWLLLLIVRFFSSWFYCKNVFVVVIVCTSSFWNSVGCWVIYVSWFLIYEIRVHLIINSDFFYLLFSISGCCCCFCFVSAFVCFGIFGFCIREKVINLKSCCLMSFYWKFWWKEGVEKEKLKRKKICKRRN